MRLFRRRPKLPADRRPPLEREERVLAWARVKTGDAAVVVTNRGLWLPGREHRLGWHDIHKAVWSGEELSVTPAEQVAERDGYVVMADGPAESYPLSDPGEVPNQVRIRVTGSVAFTEHFGLEGGGVRVAGRRVSGVNGLTWTVRYDPGTDPDDEAIVEQTDRLVAAVRQATEATD
ncbi:MAG TPA: hypothetical protein VFX60_07200 [Micromonospora sp.]|nr:hypothetical protein [Micromonospora sp.]